MRENLLLTAIFTSAVVLLSSCQVIGDIFKAGVWVGVIVVVVIIALVLWLIGKARK
ncbi:MAG: hypothetical protein JWQ09_1664 [Segetibacter sp.]|nr:hypothetical protein [Segetibacter sp.]